MLTRAWGGHTLAARGDEIESKQIIYTPVEISDLLKQMITGKYIISDEISIASLIASSKTCGGWVLSWRKFNLDTEYRCHH